MKSLCRATVVVLLVLLIPAFASASDKTLRELGPLLFSGRGAEARAELIKARDAFAAEGNTSQEAAASLLLGAIETSLGDEEQARGHMRKAAERFTAAGDYFGAWMALWSIARLETNEAATTEAIAAYGRVFEQLREASAPDARFSLESVETLGAVFGASTEMLAGAQALPPEFMKPILLRFAQIVSHDGYAKLLLDNGDLATAEKELDKASELASLFGGLFDGSLAVRYGRLREQQWRLDDARESYMKALNHAQTLGPMFTPPAAGSDPWIELNVLGHLADIELLRGRLEESLAWNDRSLKLAREKADLKREARVLDARADLLQKGGRHDAAVPLYEEALKLARQTGSRSLEADVHSDLGAVHMFAGAYGTAAKHLEKAIALYQELKEPYLEAPVWILMAEVYSLLEADTNAEIAIENARKLAQKSEFKAATAMVGLLASARNARRGRGTVAEIDAEVSTFLKMPEVKSLMFSPGVEEMLRESTRLVAGAAPRATAAMERDTTPFAAAFADFIHGKNAMNRGEYEKARGHFQQALTRNPNRDHKAGLLGAIGAAYWREGNGAQAIRYFRQAADALDASAADVKVEELLTSFLGSDRRWYFDLLIDMLVSEGHAIEAFAEAERARARAFLQMIGNHRLNGAVSADPRLVAEGENVRAAIVQLETELMSARPEQAALVAASLERARDHYRAVLIRMKAVNPEYADLTNVAPLEIGPIREDIAADTTLVSYYVSARAVHAWVIDRENAHHELLRLDQAALRSLLCWADELGSRSTRGAQPSDSACGASNPAAASDAYRALIEPLRKHIRHQKLLLVPHGVLHYLPFSALRNPDTNRYLVQDYTLTFAPSASALRFMRAKETPVDGGALVLGDPATPLRNLATLPGAQQEASFVARAVGTTPHIGSDAREALIYGLKGKTDLVHLAAHALYDPANPLFSRVALAPGDTHDGSLTVTEILSGVDFRGVNLVVLSACRSAVGQRSGGDEIVGLTRAFLYAGTPGVVSTLWNIDDAAAAGLMNEFYRRLGDGTTAAEALRHAQLALLGSESHSHPKYWAAFMLTGDPQGRWGAPRP